MPKRAQELTALEVGRIKKPGMHAVGGVPGLHLQVTDTGAGSWLLRVLVGGKRREIGLGGYPAVTLAQAREKARATRDDIVKGVDPVAQRKAARSALMAQHEARSTFDECARRFIESKAAEWKNPKHRAQWAATLETYASPTIGKLNVQDVTLAHVVKILEADNLWTTKTETASRLRGRIEAVLDWAADRCSDSAGGLPGDQQALRRLDKQGHDVTDDRSGNDWRTPTGAGCSRARRDRSDPSPNQRRQKQRLGFPAPRTCWQ